MPVVVFVHDAAELDERAEPALQAAWRDALAGSPTRRRASWGPTSIVTGAGSISRGGGVRPVRQVAVDDTWSALRFRPSERGNLAVHADLVEL
ncbi:MAG: hypothetical protein ABR592_03455 [Nitriliruptorales bacterium]